MERRPHGWRPKPKSTLKLSLCLLQTQQRDLRKRTKRAKILSPVSHKSNNPFPAPSSGVGGGGQRKENIAYLRPRKFQTRPEPFVFMGKSLSTRSEASSMIPGPEGSARENLSS
ncbi:hypothetical protein CDAR_486181 [Caerostris darwini]|uniref:Uncharacterized protein n=1 Tax=Caerostris darwini TaxID=1538125 RepID=A0AAV4MBA1_9ARAC|nr:hypothetical protein CDAR_486181 [Caerostris darwini]